MKREEIKQYMEGEMRGLSSPFTLADKGKYVLTGLIQGSYDMKIGRLVQVRVKQGAFGTDVVLIREPDGYLSSHHNQCFWIIREHHNNQLDNLFKDVCFDDADVSEYSIEGKDRQKGFLIFKEH